MSTYLLGRRVTFATMLALIILTAMMASPATAVTNIDACQTLDKFGETYRVTQDLSICGLTDCLIVANDRITIDLQGHQIVSDCPTPAMGITDAAIARDGIIVKNGTISFFFVGIDLAVSTRTTVRNVTASANLFGIGVGSQSLVKDCHVHDNSLTGVTGGDRVQIHGCDASENAIGITGGAQCLITSNDVSSNRFLGIGAGERCTVSHNVANENGVGGGIAVGAKSLVTSNVANINERLGISVVCPSTVTNNTATGNGSVNYEFVGDGCHTNNNN